MENMEKKKPYFGVHEIAGKSMYPHHICTPSDVKVM